MPVELLRDSLKLDQMIGQESAQAIIEGDILVPDTKPDITRVLSVDGTIYITKYTMEENKIIAEGNIQFKILYVSEGGSQPLYSVDSSTGFKQSIELEGIGAHMTSDVTAEIEHIDYTINNERKIGVKAVVNLSATVVEEKNVEVTRELNGLEDIELLKETIQYTDVVGTNSSDTLVKDTFEIEEDLEGIKEVLKWDARVLEREVKVTDGKVIVGGTLLVDLLYVTDDELSLNIFKKELPFTHFVEIQGTYSDMKAKINMGVEEVYTEVKENIQGERKIVEIEAIVRIQAKVMETETREVIVDAYSPSQLLKIEKNQMILKENMGLNRSYMLLRETLDIPANHPPVKEVFSIQCKPICTDYQLVEDKALIEGVVEANVIYTSEEDLQPLYSFNQEIPFRQAVDLEGLSVTMEADIEMFVEQVDYDLINGEQIEIKVNIGATCEAYQYKTIEVIHEVMELQEDVDISKRPSLTVYFMQSEDSLWKVAKKYHTTVKQILESNGIENPEAVKAGDQLIIEKVHHFKF
ncbi:Peptidoglycan-binding LysM [Alkaliphilus metalliredigens QYMF]|uniref:Peptidoglycan-binding LysM n=1 Tax=Alkaliphilus metalliredigens (strain QYMF) TaxID=293826 RepID=A6TWV8_ALKMQ|nr:SPOCS domain-containing protein [Alkaliphilus metalliredigens]ABR50676.1 Peptidoglycan-binding LysM [Alkaliphilus metalliredigens QYMF]